MFSELEPTPSDPILEIAAQFRKDPRKKKIDLGIGVYKNNLGKTPVLESVMEAEKELLKEQDTKSYVGILGDTQYNQSILQLVLGSLFRSKHSAAIQTPGGSGALWILLSLVSYVRPEATVWVSSPTWDNHRAIAEACRLKVREYNYFDPQTFDIAFDKAIEDLSDASNGDVVILHGCCHNPTGADLSLEQWDILSSLFLKNKLVPLIDVAYLGFGKGIEEDAKGFRNMIAQLPEALVAMSCSKNFGIYRERTGCAFVVCESIEDSKAVENHLKRLMRSSISMPPDHGAAVVRSILNNESRYKLWESELSSMRDRMRDIRIALSDSINQRTCTKKFEYIKKNNGMFSLVDFTVKEVRILREEYAIYLIENGRINIAAISENNIDFISTSFAEVIDRRGAS